ncbi:hypothetical protein GYMLUDRAFT_49272 [Collybiopsis luxurians FD-317 M1]|uniref:Uncharacterized protein n=1 Tax=Collybiopsis luxurians FD-317 M1 TaxID=944289 RepID=A0A0D0CF52_9AGAR|nr:hypothetical protein GYMLUDRAFT_49272 [Collybiopsis luxurians FD-317 M1]
MGLPYRQSHSLCFAVFQAAPLDLLGQLINRVTGKRIARFVRAGPTTIVNLCLLHPLSSVIKRPRRE